MVDVDSARLYVCVCVYACDLVLQLDKADVEPGGAEADQYRL